MWRLFCYSHGKQAWKGKIYEKEEEVYDSTDYLKHLSHNTATVKDDKNNNFELFRSF